MDYKIRLNEILKLMLSGEEAGFKVLNIDKLIDSYKDLYDEYDRFIDMLHDLDDQLTLSNKNLGTSHSEEKSFSYFVFCVMMIKTYFPSIEALNNAADIEFEPAKDQEDNGV